MPVKYVSKLPFALKTEIEQTYGKHIYTSRDCLLLSREIFKKTKAQVNSNTLRRLFGLVKTTHNPSDATLNILAKFCGYQSWEEVPENYPDGEEEFIPRQYIINFIAGILKELSPSNRSDPTQSTLYKHLILFLSKNPSIARAFQMHLLNMEETNISYFEHFIYLDKINDFYGDGLRKYAVKNSTDEVDLFSYNLLVFRYWLTMETESLNNTYAKISTEKRNNCSDIVLKSLVYAAKLYHAHANNLCAEKAIQEIKRFYLSSSAHVEGNQQLFSFKQNLAQALIFTGHYDEGLYYLELALDNYTELNCSENTDAYQLLSLLKVVSLYQMKQLKAAEKLFEHIQPSQFGFLSKQFCTIIYMSLSLALKSSRPSDKQELSLLIAETGFKRMDQLLNK